MTRKWLIFGFLLLTITLVACEQDEITTPTATTAAAFTPVPTSPPTDVTPMIVEPVGEAVSSAGKGIFFSELLPGVPGGNNTEFIELYNAGAQAVDLNGYSLWYLLGDGQEPTLVYEWTERADIPGQGYFLLVRAGVFT